MGLLILYATLSIFFSFRLGDVLSARRAGKAYAKTLANFKQDIDKPLIAILTVNTISHTVGAILVGVQAEKIYGDGGNAVGIVSAVMTVAILVLSGEFYRENP